jgi:hemerythrin-like domain-containing protein
MGMKRNARPSLFDLVAFDDPLEMLLACHRKIEKQLETLKRLRVHLATHGVDPEASAAAQALLRYFDKAATNHNDDEEQDLFPLLEQRITDAGEFARFRDFRAEIERDHREIEAKWARMRRPLEGIAEGLTRGLLADDVLGFVGAYARHIRVEETALVEFFNRWLDDDDRRALGQSMSARRHNDNR